MLSNAKDTKNIKLVPNVNSRRAKVLKNINNNVNSNIFKYDLQNESKKAQMNIIDESVAQLTNKS